MKLTLFIIAAILMTAWIIGFFIFKAGTMIHVFIILSALCIMQGIIFTPRPQLEEPPAI